MTKQSVPEAAAETLLEIDDAAREAMEPLRHQPAIKVVSAISDVADQWPLRLISGGVLVAGLVRRDARMVIAGARMLLAHEIATHSKNAIKHRIDRSRPRSAVGEDGHRPKPGRRKDKEKSSFPSGHSAGAMAVASAFAAEFPEYRKPAMIAAGSIALAQIPRCAHYPTDVGAGLAIGACANWLAGWMIAGLTRIGPVLPASTEAAMASADTQDEATT